MDTQYSNFQPYIHHTETAKFPSIGGGEQSSIDWVKLGTNMYNLNIVSNQQMLFIVPNVLCFTFEVALPNKTKNLDDTFTNVNYFHNFNESWPGARTAKDKLIVIFKRVSTFVSFISKCIKVSTSKQSVISMPISLLSEKEIEQLFFEFIKQVPQSLRYEYDFTYQNLKDIFDMYSQQDTLQDFIMKLQHRILTPQQRKYLQDSYIINKLQTFPIKMFTTFVFDPQYQAKKRVTSVAMASDKSEYIENLKNIARQQFNIREGTTYVQKLILQAIMVPIIDDMLRVNNDQIKSPSQDIKQYVQYFVNYYQNVETKQLYDVLQPKALQINQKNELDILSRFSAQNQYYQQLLNIYFDSYLITNKQEHGKIVEFVNECFAIRWASFEQLQYNKDFGMATRNMKGKCFLKAFYINIPKLIETIRGNVFEEVNSPKYLFPQTEELNPKTIHHKSKFIQSDHLAQHLETIIQNINSPKQFEPFVIPITSLHDIQLIPQMLRSFIEQLSRITSSSMLYQISGQTRMKINNFRVGVDGKKIYQNLQVDQYSYHYQDPQCIHKFVERMIFDKNSDFDKVQVCFGIPNILQFLQDKFKYLLKVYGRKDDPDDPYSCNLCGERFVLIGKVDQEYQQKEDIQQVIQNDLVMPGERLRKINKLVKGIIKKIAIIFDYDFIKKDISKEQYYDFLYVVNDWIQNSQDLENYTGYEYDTQYLKSLTDEEIYVLQQNHQTYDELKRQYTLFIIGVAIAYAPQLQMVKHLKQNKPKLQKYLKLGFIKTYFQNIKNIQFNGVPLGLFRNLFDYVLFAALIVVEFALTEQLEQQAQGQFSAKYFVYILNYLLNITLNNVQDLSQFNFNTEHQEEDTVSEISGLLTYAPSHAKRSTIQIPLPMNLTIKSCWLQYQPNIRIQEYKSQEDLTKGYRNSFKQKVFPSKALPSPFESVQNIEKQREKLEIEIQQLYQQIFKKYNGIEIILKGIHNINRAYNVIEKDEIGSYVSKQHMDDNVLVIVPAAKKQIIQCTKTQKDFNYTFVFEDEKYIVNILTLQIDTQPQMNKSDQFVLYLIPQLKTLLTHFDDPRAYFYFDTSDNKSKNNGKTFDTVNALIVTIQRLTERILRKRLYIDNTSPLTLLELKVIILKEINNATQKSAQKYIQWIYDMYCDMNAKHSLNDVYQYMLSNKNIQIDIDIEYYNEEEETEYQEAGYELHKAKQLDA